MKQLSKKTKGKKMTEDGDRQPSLKREEHGLNTAFFIAEAALNEPPEPADPAPAEEPPALAAAPPISSAPLIPLAALWPVLPSPGASEPSPASRIPTPPSTAPAARLEPPQLPRNSNVAKPDPLCSASPRIKVPFMLQDLGARQVSIAGDFNGWASNATPMQRSESGQWETILELEPGRYQYKFVVDGEWIADPLASEQVWNRHGTLNSVIEVRI